MRTEKEIKKKIFEIYELIDLNKFDVLRGIVIADALCWVLGEDYLENLSDKDE